MDVGYTLRPKSAFFNRIRFFTTNYYDEEPNGSVVSRRVSVGSGMDGRWNSFLRFELNQDGIAVGRDVLTRFRPRIYFELTPSSVLNLVSLDSNFGQEIDFDNGREGHGASLSGTVSVRPNDHLEVRGIVNRRWLDVDAGGGLSGRLFTAQVERLRATWTFNARAFVRLIGQYVQTTRDPALYTFATSPKSALFSTSALFAYKLNWQTVLYAGYGEQRAFSAATDQLEPSGRQLFAKLSYAWQH